VSNGARPKRPANRVVLTLGTVHAAVDLISFDRDPLMSLELVRSSRGSVIWTSIAVPSEEDADGIVRRLREMYPSSVVEAGLRPVVAVHGMASYEKYVVLDLTDDEEEQVRRLVAAAFKRPRSARGP